MLDVRPDVVERKMFSGIAFLITGDICCGVPWDDLIVRLDPEHAGALTSPEHGTRPFDVTRRPMRG